MEILMNWKWMMQILIMMSPIVIMEKAKKVQPMQVAWSWSQRRVYMTSIYYFWISIVFTLLSFRFASIPPLYAFHLSTIISSLSLSLSLSLSKWWRLFLICVILLSFTYLIGIQYLLHNSWEIFGWISSPLTI